VRLFVQRLLIALALCGVARAAPSSTWRLTRNNHFEIYSQTTDQRTRQILEWFEQLRAFFAQQGASKMISSPPVRIIVFASEREYEPYRLRATADAYSVGTGSQDYIVMGSDNPLKFGLAAHEYAHLASRAWNLQQLPLWLSEGVAEFFATLRIAEHGTALGGALPGRMQTLETATWMPLADLMSLSEEARGREERGTAKVFYAESWALTEMLVLSPNYAPQFKKFIASLRSGSSSLEALQAAYAKSPDAITHDLRDWLGQRVLPAIQLPEVVAESGPVDVSEVSLPASKLLLAQVLLAAGEFDRSEARFLALAQEAPNAEISTALGMIALHKGDSDGARRAWKRAIDQGIADATLCYRYAILADQAGLPDADIRPALERAVTLQPEFDDAHYQLALLEKNAGHYEAALREFRAMQMVSDPRAYAYWLALADTFNELGQRDEAQSAAEHANEHASTPSERARAAEEIYIAQTDPGVQFSRDPSGQLQLVTTRKPHQQSDWNPFIEASDEIHRVQGTLREIECGSVTTIRVEAAGKLVKLAIPDLQHVQMRHAPSEFVCGPQTAMQVIVDYARTPSSATDGIVRGMDF
jgi:tetratricopeptide (TPR) repeat protein